MSTTEGATSSGLQTGDAAIYARPSSVTSITLISDNTNACTVVLYDNASAATGTVLAKLSVKATDSMQFAHFDAPIIANNGIYADVTGTGAAYIVTYYPR